MKQVMLNIKQDKDLDILLPLLDRLGITIQEDKSNPKKKLSDDEYKKYLQIISRTVEVSSFGDALAYQKEVRKDRKLPYRED